jgi:uncharacterized membrane protein YdjX (TVP38/TMEM64 family)
VRYAQSRRAQLLLFPVYPATVPLFKKVALSLAVLAAVALTFALHAGGFLDFGFLKEQQGELRSLYERRPVAVLGAFFFIYVAATALSMPWAAVLALAGGAIFGLAWGTVVVSAAASLGALLAFLAARYLLRDFVQARLRQRVADIDEGLQKDGAMYLFTLRLAPLVPFFVVNLAMGLTGMRAWTYSWVSFLGMLPCTVVYVFAGTQLATIESSRDVLSPPVMAALLLLAAFPWFARASLRAVRRRFRRRELQA